MKEFTCTADGCDTKVMATRRAKMCGPCRAERNRKWARKHYAENLEKVRERKRKYYAENPEKVIKRTS